MMPTPPELTIEQKVEQARAKAQKEHQYHYVTNLRRGEETHRAVCHCGSFETINTTSRKDVTEDIGQHVEAMADKAEAELLIQLGVAQQ